MASDLANFMVPLEYGISRTQKGSIGINITAHLCKKLLGDLHKEVDPEDGNTFQLDENAVNQADVRNLNRRVHTRLYFTSESHIISLLNVIRWGHVRDQPEDNREPLLSAEAAALFDSISANGMAFLTHFVLSVHESPDYPADSTDRFRVRVLFSPGANNRELKVVDAVPLTPPEGLPLNRVAHYFQEVLGTVDHGEGSFSPPSRIGGTDDPGHSRVSTVPLSEFSDRRSSIYSS
jgi:inositol hexakisphosphate/diphosphoinositol-pentakisphosphate kinase